MVFQSQEHTFMAQNSANLEIPIQEKHLSDFYDALGVRTFSVANFLWRSAGLRLFTPVPMFRPISLSANDLDAMWEQGAFFVHFPTTDAGPGFPGYIFVVDDKEYDFGNIKSSDRRHNIRRGFKHCEVKSVPFEVLMEKADPLIRDTYYRQGRNCDDTVVDGWRNYFRAASGNPLFEAWAAFVSNRLAAFKVEFTYQGVVQADMVFSLKELLKYYPVNALLFLSTQQAVRRDGISYVSYGMTPVTGEPNSLIEFKESMGFKKLDVNHRVVVNPRLKPAFSFPLRFLLKALADHYYERSAYARIVSGVISKLREQTEHCR
jgi:hypothetical protein